MCLCTLPTVFVLNKEETYARYETKFFAFIYGICINYPVTLYHFAP